MRACMSQALDLIPLPVLLLDVHIQAGALICPESGRRFPINEGVPNMLLHEDEI